MLHVVHRLQGCGLVLSSVPIVGQSDLCATRIVENAADWLHAQAMRDAALLTWHVLVWTGPW